MFLMIQNKGEADVRSFTILGLSTARGQQESIGMFGSGAKHAINVLLRNGITPSIYSGRTKIHFFSKPDMMGDVDYHQVYVKVDQKAAQKVSWCLEFGEMDWTNPDMGIREFISNAIDQSGNAKNVVIDVVDKPRAKAGYTRVFLPLTHEVQAYYNNIHDNFLHFSNRQVNKFMPKKEGELTTAKLYRKGVLVGQLALWHKPSIFNYNLGDELSLDESRNLNEWNARTAICKAVLNSTSAIRSVIRHMKNGEFRMEHSLSYSHHIDESNYEDIKNAWHAECGEAIMCDIPLVAESIQKKGFNTIICPGTHMYEAFEAAGVPTGASLLFGVEHKGYEIVETTDQTQATFDQVWSWLEMLKLTGGKKAPELKNFKATENKNQVICGFYENNIVFINTDYEHCHSTMLEELSHYITLSTDLSRDFQSFAFKVAVELGKLLDELTL